MPDSGFTDLPAADLEGASATTSRYARINTALRRNSRDLAAGLLLIAFGVTGLILVDDRVRALVPWSETLPPSLSSARGANLGAGSFPFGLFVLLAALGAFLALKALVRNGERLEVWRARSVISIFAAVLLFGITIRPLGLVIAGPIAVVLGSLATTDYRWGELTVSAIGTTAASIVIFDYFLKLSIPIAPWMGW